MQEIFLLIGSYIVIMGALSFYKFFTTKNEGIKALYKRKLIIGSVLTAVALVFFFFTGMFTRHIYGVGMGGAMMVPQVTTSSMTIARQPNYYNNSNGNVSDTREYTKKTFYASMMTRAVEDVSKKVEALIKSSGGRIDNSTVSNTSASFSFVVPKSSFDAFETQIRSLVGKKLYSQTVTSQNLLSEKQNIEKNQARTQETIAATKKQRDQIEAEYTARINAIKSKIATVKGQILEVDTNIAKTERAINSATDQYVKTSLEQELNDLSNTRRTYNQYIATYTSEIEVATTNYKSQMTMYGYSLDNQNQVLTQLGVEETAFLDKVETVQGTISINFITLWQLLNIFSPVNLWVVFGILLLAGRLYLLKKEEDRARN